MGLHNVDDVAADPRLWLPDGDPNTVPYSYSFTVNSGGCASKGTTKVWKISCNYANEYTCERHWGECYASTGIVFVSFFIGLIFIYLFIIIIIVVVCSGAWG